MRTSLPVGRSVFALDLALQPLRLFRRLLSEPPNWWRAMAALALCGTLDITGKTWLAVDLTHPLISALSRTGANANHIWAVFIIAAVIGSGSYWVTWIAGSVVLIALEVLLGRVSSKPYSRLFELTGCAFYSQVPFLLFSLVVSASFRPPPMLLGVGGRDIVLASFQEYNQQIRDSARFAVTRGIGIDSELWLLALMVISLSALVGISLKRGVAYWLALVLIVVALPRVL